MRQTLPGHGVGGEGCTVGGGETYGAGVSWSG